MERYLTEKYNFIAKDTVNVLSDDVTLYNGLDVYVQIDIDKGCKFWFIRNSNHLEYL
jgi:hypothetical protein